MKNYRSDVGEIVRRKREFDEHYSESYDDNNVIISLPDPKSSELFECSVAELLEFVDENTESQEEKNVYLTLCAQNRLFGLACYVLRYSAIDYFLKHTPEEDISCFSDGVWDKSTLSSGEIYDVLITLLPSYAEAIISQIEATGIDINEAILDAFNNRDKQEFTRLLREEKGNVWRVSTICKYIKENSCRYWGIKNASDIALIKSNTDIVRNVEWQPDSLEGQRMLNLLNLHELSEHADIGNEEARSALARAVEDEVRALYIRCMSIFFNNKDDQQSKNVGLWQ